MNAPLGVIGTFGKQENLHQVLKKEIQISGLFIAVVLRKEKVLLTLKIMMKNGMHFSTKLDIQEELGDGGLQADQTLQLLMTFI